MQVLCPQILLNKSLTGYFALVYKRGSFPIVGKSGDVAQLGERRVRNAEVRGSIPLISTIFCLSNDDPGRDAVPGLFLCEFQERPAAEKNCRSTKPRPTAGPPVKAAAAVLAHSIIFPSFLYVASSVFRFGMP